MRIFPVSGSSQSVAYTNAAIELASNLAAGADYVFGASTACFVRQGTALKITCATQANIVDTDFMTITVRGVAVVYEFDKAGNGVTAGRVQVNISADSTAATVAARLRTAILANQTMLRVIDPADGTLQVDLADSRDLAITENVAHASFTITAGIMQASVGAGSLYVPAGAQPMPHFTGNCGAQISVIREASDGRANIARYRTP